MAENETGTSWKLTLRQQSILDEFERGAVHKETAAKLGISISTVKTHVRIILAKTGARSMVEAVWRRRMGTSSKTI